MKIKSSKNFSGPIFPEKASIKKHHVSRLAFNFSFLTQEKDYSLKSRKISKDVKLKLLERISSLSEEDKVLIMNRPKEQGLEPLPEEVVNLHINSDFKKSGRYDECDEYYWVFRLSKKGRVIGKINENIFYILAIDPKFKLYKHG